MVLLKTLKKHINQFVVPDIKCISDEEINFYPNHQSNATVNSPKKADTPIQNYSFQETYEKSYSHGLENIYAIETIDLKTVKPLSSSAEQSVYKSEISTYKKYSIEKPLQLEFIFGGKFKTQIDSFLLSVPIFHLDLPTHCLKSLQEQGNFYIRDLLRVDLNNLGLNYPSVEEIKKKLAAKLENKELTECTYVDFSSWLTSLIPEDNRIKFYLLFEKYQLNHLTPLSGILNIELKRLKQDERQNHIISAKEQLYSLDRIELVKSNKKLIKDIFLLPWLRERLGISEEYEIYDFLEQISENIYESSCCINLLSDLYSNGKFLFHDVLTHDENGHYFADENTKSTFQLVEKRALTYFANKNNIYEIQELVQWIQKEFALKWIGFPTGFVEKVIQKSSFFYTYKNKEQKILVQYSRT